MELKKLCDWLDVVFKDYKCEKDMSNNGVQVAGTQEVKRIAFAVDACLDTIEKAAAGGADMLFVHHGLSWKDGFKRLTGKNAERFRALFQSNLSLYALHLPLDAHEEIGNNAVLANWLNLKAPKRFYDYHGMDIGMLIGPYVGGVVIELLIPVMGSEVAAYSTMWLVMTIPIIAGIVFFVSQSRRLAAYEEAINEQEAQGKQS